MHAGLSWLWIPITLWAAFAQTLRNAAQRHLTAELGTLGATLVRFLYGLPFGVLWLVAASRGTGRAVPSVDLAFFAWVALGSVSQIVATALLLRVMAERNFTLGVAYSKTEVVQVTAFGLLFLGDPITLPTLVAVVFATAGVLFLSPPAVDRPLRTILTGWAHRSALLGLASGAGYAFASIAYRGAALTFSGTSFLMAAATTLVWAQSLQTILLGGWLLIRQPEALLRVFAARRASLFAGFMGAAASAGWFTALAIEPAAHVRTLGLIELIFAVIVSLKIFRERLRPLEVAGIGLLVAGIVIITL